MKCCICKGEIEKKMFEGKVYWDKGENAEPVKKGRCCVHCNIHVVLPARMIGMTKEVK